MVPESALDMADGLVSLGICDDWSFDRDFISRNPTAIVHAYDHTISGPLFKSAYRSALLRCLRRQTSWADACERRALWQSYLEFFGRPRIAHFPERVYKPRERDKDVDFEVVLERMPCPQVFVKMDIEAVEYRMIDDLIKFVHRITGMVIEFHDTIPLRLTFSHVVCKLQVAYEIVHLHGNNCGLLDADGLPDVLEITFLRKDLCQNTGKRASLPLPILDQPNCRYRTDFFLHFVL